MVVAARSSADRRELLRTHPRDRWAALGLAALSWVGAVVSVVAHGTHGVLVPGEVVVVGGLVLWRAWRPAVFVTDERIVIRNVFSRQTFRREEVRSFRIARIGSRTMCVWALTTRGATAVDAASRPRFSSATRDLEADLAALTSWLTHSDGSPPPTVAYLP